MNVSMAESSTASNAGIRNPKACQECRKRKIRCNGENPCKTCEQRNVPCEYRDHIRLRRKKHEYLQSHRDPTSASALTQRPGQQTSIIQNFPASVSATHMTSPSCQMQLYYGPTSHFALMQHIYRDFVTNPTAHTEPSGEVDEAGAGLDLFSFRRIFFGTPDTHDGASASKVAEFPVMFLPYDLAKMFLTRFLNTLYHVMPHRPKAFLEQCLEQLYKFPQGQMDTLLQSRVLLALATGALGTEHYAWGDVLYERVKTSLTSYDDVVNIQTIQISLLMISNYQNEQGRPNSAFLHLGTAARKALSAGLHKDVPHDDIQTPESIEERRITFWSLYVYETWFCFHTGRPSSLSLKDIAIELPEDPFIRLLVQLCKTVTRSTNEIYGERHESLLHMWRVARSIADDLRNHNTHMQQALGFGLDDPIQAGSVGSQQTIFTTLYHHTKLLAFRPFLIFRGHWRRTKLANIQQPGTSPPQQPQEIPSWLNEACNHALSAAQKTIHHLFEASRANDDVRQLRYHGYFIGSSSFTLIYDFLHDPSAAASHLPWVYVALQYLSTMRAGDPIASTIKAIQTVLRNINPAFEWSPPTDTAEKNRIVLDPSSEVPRNANMQSSSATQVPSVPLLGPSQYSLTSLGSGTGLGESLTGRSTGSIGDLLDFTQSDLGWDFDFSTMDLEAFFSIDQNAYPPAV